jgi:hypothetical protein
MHAIKREIELRQECTFMPAVSHRIHFEIAPMTEEVLVNLEKHRARVKLGR